MTEVVTALCVFFSISIFLAHAVDTFRAMIGKLIRRPAEERVRPRHLNPGSVAEVRCVLG
jgi:hypothetical protein